MHPPTLIIANPIGKVLERLQFETLTAAEKMIEMHESALIVFSHLRWEFVMQRPQHIMNRLAKHQHVYFVEEPIDDASTVMLPKIKKVAKNITVVQPRMQNNEKVTAKWLLSQTEVQKNQPILWFYSAAFINMTTHINSSLIIYDCMDELSAFKGANHVLQAQEKQLLNIADVVFTGGKSLYGAKKKFHHTVYCFPSSVDTSHFNKALSSSTKVPSDIASIPGPIVGFYGVLDERLDSKLLSEIAQKSPDISFVLIGPVVKISQNDLPIAPNLYYLGSKKYQQLPAYLKAFDITFMPFAINEATTFISPTKTLEYMAALKPILSTPIYDVVSDYKHVVSICQTAAGFARAIRTYLDESTANRALRIAVQKKIVANTSWDKTVDSMSAIMLHSLASKLQQTTWSETVACMPSTAVAPLLTS